MQMNSGIILAGQQPDFVNVLARSTQAAGQADAVRQQQKDFGQTNALRQLYQSQGAQIAAGDQNALNALAQFDPQAALGVQQSIAGQGRADAQLDMQGRGLDMREQEFGMRVKEYAAGLSAQERAAEAEKIKTGVFSASAATSPEQWDQIVTQMGQPELAGQFANKDALLRQYMTAAQILEANKGPENAPLSAPGKLMADLRAGRITIEQFNSASQKTGMRATISPDGTMMIEEGVPVSGGGQPKLTVDAAKNTGFLVRTRESNKILNDLEAQGTRFGQQNLDKAPLGLGNYARDSEFQQFDQARRDFVNAILRRESGAVISDQEFENANQQYFPVPGDSPEVIKQKRANRVSAIRGIELGSGEGAAFVDAQDAAAAETQAPAAEAFDPKTPDFSTFSDEELQKYIEGGGQ